MKRCAIYARVSTEEQTKKFGLDVQLSELRSAAKARGYFLDSSMEFIDDGYSGSYLDRPALNRLREAVAAGEVDVILIYDPDRLARNLVHQLVLCESFEKAGVVCQFITAEFQDSPEGRMFFQMKGVFADYERTKFLDRTRRGRLQKARQGFVSGGWVSYGYRYIRKKPGEKGGSYEVNGPEAQVVRRVFSWVLEGYSARSIVSKLNDEGIPASRSPKWCKSSVLRLLRNEWYIGRAYSNRYQHVLPAIEKPSHVNRRNKKTTLRIREASEWIALDVPQIVDVETFGQAQILIKKNASQLSGRNSHFCYLLKGLLRCGICKNGYAGCPGHGRRYYRCMGRDRLKRVCRAGLLNAEKIESLVWKIVLRVLTNTSVLKEKIKEFHQRVHAQQSDLQERLADLERSYRTMQGVESKLLNEFLDPELPISRDTYTRKHAEIAAKLRSIETSIAEVRRQLASSNSAAYVNQVMESVRIATSNLFRLNNEAKQRLMRTLLDKVTLSGRNVEIIGILPSTPVANRPQHASCRASWSGKDDACQTHPYHPSADQL
jgi:site-specific DNA recombinase